MDHAHLRFPRTDFHVKRIGSPLASREGARYLRIDSCFSSIRPSFIASLFTICYENRTEIVTARRACCNCLGCTTHSFCTCLWWKEPAMASHCVRELQCPLVPGLRRLRFRILGMVRTRRNESHCSERR